MTKNKKIVLGVLTALPLLFLVIYFISFFSLFWRIFTLEQEPGVVADPSFFFASFGVLFAMIMLAVLLALGLMVYYIIHVSNNKNLEGNQRLIWILVVVFAGLIGYLVYWYLHIWKEPENFPENGY